MRAIKEIMEDIEYHLGVYYSKNETPNVFEFVLKIENDDVAVSSFFLNHGHERMTHENVKNNPEKYFSFPVEGEMDDDGKKLKDWDSRKDALREKIECDLRCELEDKGCTFMENTPCECELRECFECNGKYWDDSEEKIADLISKKHARENF